MRQAPLPPAAGHRPKVGRVLRTTVPGAFLDHAAQNLRTRQGLLMALGSGIIPVDGSTRSPGTGRASHGGQWDRLLLRANVPAQRVVLVVVVLVAGAAAASAQRGPGDRTTRPRHGPSNCSATSTARSTTRPRPRRRKPSWPNLLDQAAKSKADPASHFVRPAGRQGRGRAGR